MASISAMSLKRLVGNTQRWSSGGQGPQSPSAPFSPSASLEYDASRPTAPPPPSEPDKELERVQATSAISSPAGCLSPTPQPQTPFVTLYPSHPDQARIARFPYVPVERATDTTLLLKFFDTGFSSPSRNADPLMLAVYHGSLPDIRFFLHHGNYDLTSAHNSYGESLIHLAAASPSPYVCSVLQELIEKGGMTNVNCKDYALRTPLHVAAAATGPAGVNAPAVVKALVLWEADVDAEDENGQTPLHVAVAAGHHQVARLLLSHMAKVGRKDKKGRTPLALAVKKGDVNLVRMLVAHGARVEGEELGEGGEGGGGGGEGGRREIQAVLREQMRKREEKHKKEEDLSQQPHHQHQEETTLSSSASVQGVAGLVVEVEFEIPLVPEEEREEEDETDEGLEEEVLDPLRVTLELPLDDEEREENMEAGEQEEEEGA